jgi:hypothetical protein
LPWRYDENRQEFHTPSGRIITLTSIATMLDDQLHNRHDFGGPWTGWRMRGNRLSPPRCGSAALKPDTGQAFLRWIEAATPYTSASDAVRDLIDRIKASA